MVGPSKNFHVLDQTGAIAKRIESERLWRRRERKSTYDPDRIIIEAGAELKRHNWIGTSPEW